MPSSSANHLVFQTRKHLALIALVAVVSGCDAVDKLRAFLRGDDVVGAALRVEVVPAKGIRILLDGKELAQNSPFQTDGLPAGPHELEVRGLGYYPVKLPIALVEGKLTTVPVALRAGAPAVIPAPSSDGATPPEPPAPALPFGVSPITLTVAATPQAAVRLDGAEVLGKQIKLERVYGTLEAGPLSLKYRLGGSGLLEFTLPSNEAQATWTHDSNILLPGNSFRLHQGVVRLTRIAPDGSGQTVLLKR